jgi:acylphosphatase
MEPWQPPWSGSETQVQTRDVDAMHENAMLETWRVRVSGRVQGIGYRQVCVRRARELGITGWVRNRLDHSVEAMLQGSPEQLAHMCRWLRDGVPAARVDELQVSPLPLPSPRFDDFVRLPTL